MSDELELSKDPIAEREPVMPRYEIRIVRYPDHPSKPKAGIRRVVSVAEIERSLAPDDLLLWTFREMLRKLQALDE